CMTTWWTSNYG
nr:immunoglobulin heavy chain junction region [Macaca mulatta]